MPAETVFERDVQRYVSAHRDDLIALLQALVRTPSENTPPRGAEAACQQLCESVLRSAGLTTDLYELDTLEGLATHPLYFPGRDYRGRPNLAATLKGTGGGRSLILTGHVDTVPAGTLPWTRDPFSGHIEGNRLYGRGSNDMKAGVATNLFVAKAIADMGLRLRGDLIFESVVDEEFGGVNGTLAGRVRGYLADAAIVSEPSFLRICPAQRGGRTVHITLRTSSEGILAGKMEAGIAEQLAFLLARIPEFAERRRATAPSHFAYEHLPNPVPVSLLKIHTGPWGWNEPMATANACKIELFWQSMPGETLEAIDAEFHAWFNSMLAARPDLFPERPSLEFPIRWLPGSSCEPNAAVLRELSQCVTEVLGAPPAVGGIEGPCDMYIFQQVYGIPAVIWGARGSNTHLADEYVEIDTVVAAAEALLLFACRWCA